MSRSNKTRGKKESGCNCWICRDNKLNKSYFKCKRLTGDMSIRKPQKGKQ